MTPEELIKVNSTITTVNIKGKDYATVNARVLAFRTLFPNGCIRTEVQMTSPTECIARTTVTDEEFHVLATGTAHEEKEGGYINKTSFVENCETSAVGRALGFLGIGADGSICSGDELAGKSQAEKILEQHEHSLWDEFVARCFALDLGDPAEQYKELRKKHFKRLDDMIDALGPVDAIGYEVKNTGGKKDA